MKLQLFASIALVLLNAVPGVASAETGSLRGQVVDESNELVEYDYDNDYGNDDGTDDDNDWDNDGDDGNDFDNDDGNDFDNDDGNDDGNGDGGQRCNRGKECGPGVRCKKGRCVPKSEFELWLDSMKVW